MKIKYAFAIGVAALAMVTTAADAASYVYVGSWAPADGPYWTTNPLAYSGVGAAAMLFGGSAANYAISTIDSNVANLNFMANYEVIGLGGAVFADTYFRGVEGVTRYQDVYIFDPARDTVSSYVNDFGNDKVNYAFRIAGGVPEPQNWALLIAGFGLIGAVARRRRQGDHAVA